MVNNSHRRLKRLEKQQKEYNSRLTTIRESINVLASMHALLRHECHSNYDYLLRNQDLLIKGFGMLMDITEQQKLKIAALEQQSSQ